MYNIMCLVIRFMNLANKKDVKSVLSAEGFSFKKSLGQNFLIDDAVCPRMAQAIAGENVGVLEIGPGAGVLTYELTKLCKRVVSVELDTRLEPILKETLRDCDNVKIIWNDILKLDLHKVLTEEFADCDTINICANLPYYITSPVIMMLLSRNLPINTIAVMVQKEAADRLCATVGSREAGAVTVAVDYYAKAETLFKVPSSSFLPPPKVDSAVIKLTLREKPPVEIKSEKTFFKVTKACFAQRRKVLTSPLAAAFGFDKDTARNILKSVGVSETIRGEALTITQIADIANMIEE